VISGARRGDQPVAKNVFKGSTDPGHTEYLAKLSFQQTGNRPGR
jgi:hypothetical protein